MVHGNQWATSTDISVDTRILPSNINIWLQGRDGHNNNIFYSVLKKNLHCFSAVLQCLSNETGNHFVH
jgi:hypothetical protein